MKPKYRPVPLDDKAREFLETLAESPRTQDAAGDALGAFYAFRLSGAQPLALKAMGFDVLVNFNNWMIKRGYSPFSRDLYCTQVGNYLGYAVRKKWMPADFSLDLAKEERSQKRKRRSYPIPEVPEMFPQVLAYYDRQPVPTGTTPHEIAARLDLLRNRAIMLTLYSTAGRVTETARLSRKQIQDGRRAEAVVLGKGGKQRFLYFTPEAQDALQTYLGNRLDESPHVFITHVREYGTCLSRQMIWHIVRTAADALGAGAVHPHHFRHYRARQMLDQGAPLEAIKEILGHADIGTTSRVYAQYSKPALRAIFDRTTLSTRDIQEAQ